MSITRKALPLIVASSFLTGCAGLQKTDWPTCAAIGGVGGAALGAIESSSWAGGGAVAGAGLAAAYCWVHGASEEQVVVVEEVIVVTPEDTSEDTSVANKSEQQEAAVETKEEAPAEAPSTVRRPLFGSLKKPE